MIVFFIFLSIALISTGVRGSYNDLFTLIKGDFSGRDSFIAWIVSLLFLYAVSFIPGLKPVSRGMMLLVILVLFLKRGTGFFDQFNRQLGITQ